MSWKPVVVGVDGSPASVRAATLGTMIAQRTGVDCTLLGAVPDYERALGAYGMVSHAHDEAQRMLRRDREMLTAALRGFVPSAMLAELRIVTGRAAIALRDTARHIGAGLIVIGSRQRHGLGRLRGSLGAHLLRTSEIPVLATDGGATAIRRVLAALDLSYASEATLDAARDWARAFGAHLRVLHVVEPLPLLPNATLAMSEEYARADEQLRETGLWSRIDAAGTEKVVRSGYPATVIAQEAADWRADLVIVGSHGRGWAERLLVGSTAEQLLQHPPAPTLVIPVGRPAEEEAIEVGRMPWEFAAPAGALPSGA
jgi:nucleotide-binding universal stress UspA family protein